MVLDEALSLMKKINSGVKNLSAERVCVGVAAPFTFLSSLPVSGIKLGAQNVFWENSGAFTGEISPEQLRNIGIDFVILGHSERRIYLKEDNRMISKKITTALTEGLSVILCVGEPREIHEKGINATKEYIRQQIQECLPSSIAEEKLNAKPLIGENGHGLIIAYEPIWAISTFEKSEPAKPEDVEEIMRFIKEVVAQIRSLSVAVIYGGSTNMDNIESYIKQPNIEGCLVGGASLKAEEFVSMIKTVIKN